MKIFGHPWLPSEKFYPISSIEDIENTPPNSILEISNFNIGILRYCQKNSLRYMVKIIDIREAIFANNFHATYIKSSKELAKELMPIAQNYLFDTQVLATISDDSEIEEMAKIGVDGVVFLRN